MNCEHCETISHKIKQWAAKKVTIQMNTGKVLISLLLI